MPKGGRGRRIWAMFLVVTAIGVLVLALAINLRSGASTLDRISTASMDVHADFDTFWRSAEALWGGGNIYEAGARLNNMNPPFWTVLISPLGLLEPLTAYRFFVLVTLLMSVGYLAWVADELRVPARWAVVGTAMLLLSSPLLGTLALGQIYSVLALGLVVAWVADRRGRLIVSGCALGLVVAIKPSLVPVVLWPLLRRRWNTLWASLASGVGATLVGILVAGPGATFDWLRLLAGVQLDGYWDNASLPSGAARLFRENEFVEPLAIAPWMVPLAYVLGVAIVVLSVIKARGDPEMGLWTLVAASLLTSPVSWHNYLLLLGPGIFLLLARGQTALAFLLLALQSIPPWWPQLWEGANATVASLALTLYLYILVAHWLAFLTEGEAAKVNVEAGAGRSTLVE